MIFIKTEPKFYKSDITGKEYPHDEYPYSIIYFDPVIPMWSNHK